VERGRTGTGSWLEFELANDKSGQIAAHAACAQMPEAPPAARRRPRRCAAERAAGGRRLGPRPVLLARGGPPRGRFSAA
jgi:hypothetical protein